MALTLSDLRIRVVAPARWLNDACLASFSGFLEAKGATVEIDDKCIKRVGQLAGTDAERAAALLRALDDPQVNVVWCGRGGYGCARLLDHLSIDRNARPKMLIGYSDVTALHQFFLDSPHTMIHGGMPIDMDYPDKVANVVAAAEVAQRMIANEASSHAQSFALEPVANGTASGSVIAGNLAVLTRLIGTRFEPKWDRCILCLEDVGEYLYALDRMIVHLRQSQLADKIAGIVLGSFTETLDNEVPWGEPIEDIVRRHFTGIPIASGMPVGHGPRNLPIVAKQAATLTVLSDSAELALA